MSEPSTHYYTNQTWGHAVSYDLGPNHTIKGHLFSKWLVKTGDYLILPNKDSTTRYRIVGELERPMDPGDMYFFTAEFAPRSLDE